MSAPVYDAVVVGSGAAGGAAVYQLTRRGLKTLLLEAGPDIDPRVENIHHKMPFELEFRGQLSARDRLRYRGNKSTNVYNQHTMLPDSEEPYTFPDDKPFMWVRSRALGGKTLHWGRYSFRFSDYDFECASRDGFGINWPIRYRHVAPYYSLVERTIGIAGSKEGIPNLPDGEFQPALPMRCGEHILRKGVEKLGMRLIPTRVAVVTSHDFSRPRCHFCGHCNRLCGTGSMFSSRVSFIPLAQETGNLEIKTDAIVREVLIDDEGFARGVSYVDRGSRQDYEASAKTVVMAASTLSSTRILLNSGGRDHPTGLGNSSGELGRNLSEHTMAARITGIAPVLRGRMPGYPEDGHPGASFVPPFVNVDNPEEADFIRNYSFQCWSGTSDYPGHAHRLAGFGADFKRRVKNIYPALVNMTTNGEVLCRPENFVELDPEGATDPYGIPCLKIHLSFGENDRRMIRHMNDKAEEICRAAGIEILSHRKEASQPGWSIHEVCTARMGSDPKTSVLDGYNRSYDVPNLFVVDGAAFSSATALEPTLTIMALAARAGDHIADLLDRREMRKRGPREKLV